MPKLPSFYQAFKKSHPDVVNAYEALGEATRAAGPLPADQVELIKLGIAAGARVEGAIHSHVRRALDAGADTEAIRHVGIVAITTLGFARAMAVRAMIEDELRKQGRA